MNRWDRPRCTMPDCTAPAAREHSWCDAHVIAHRAGLTVSIETAREMVRNGVRAADVMADDDDWIAR